MSVAARRYDSGAAAGAPRPLEVHVREDGASLAADTRILVHCDALLVRRTDGAIVLVGTAWPSFECAPGSLSVPEILAAPVAVHDGDEALLDACEAPIASKIRARLSLAEPGGNGTVLFALDTPIMTDLLRTVVHHVLVDTGAVAVGGSLRVAFQGRAFFAEISSASTEHAGEGPVHDRGRAQQQDGTTPVITVTRETEVTIETVQGAAPGTPKTPVDTSAYESLGGLDPQIAAIRTLVELPLTRPDVFERYGLQPPKGVLLYGPPGTGKTSLARTVAASLHAHVLTINGPELSSMYHGETEAKLRSVFETAAAHERCVVIIDEIDTLAPRRDASSSVDSEGAGEVERRVVATLLTLLDGVGGGRAAGAAAPSRVVVIAATNRPNALDPALRRPGRLDREIEIGVPDRLARHEILRVLLGNVPHVLSPDELDDIAARTHGYVGADLTSLVREAGMAAIARAAGAFLLGDQMARLTLGRDAARDGGHCGAHGADAAADAAAASGAAPGGVALPVARGTQDAVSPSATALVSTTDGVPLGDRVSATDFAHAQTVVRPSAMREVFVETPRVSWADIAGGDEDEIQPDGTRVPSVQQQICECVEWPLKHASTFRRLGIKAPKGALLYGPPGCSKTLTAKALACESGLNFLTIRGPELVSKYVGDSERSIREVFRRARAAAPSILFFDELDAISGVRSMDSSNASNDRIVASLLTEMDGVDTDQHVIVVAATNRPECIDPALLRPGRLDRLVYVGPPSERTREQILRLNTKGMATAADVNLAEIAQLASGCSGAEVAAICQEAGLAAVAEDIHTTEATRSMKRRISPLVLAKYSHWRNSM
ncbi:AAA+-type ATPase [Malassezia sp. CBS 17886]|nr:AAA+-type ATPase [Malassezia sp. CBS 17886]